jgi:hypothetical protein
MSVTTTGATGAATGTTTASPAYDGELHAVYLDYGSTITATNTVRLSLASPAVAIFTLVGATVDAWYFPRETVNTGTGAAYTSTPGLVCYPHTGPLVLTMSTAAPATNAVVAYVYTKEQ